jgi:hypothetical protein
LGQLDHLQCDHKERQSEKMLHLYLRYYLYICGYIKWNLNTVKMFQINHKFQKIEEREMTVLPESAALVDRG